VRRPEEVQALVEELAVGETVRLRVVRADRELTVSVTVGDFAQFQEQQQQRARGGDAPDAPQPAIPAP
jgi:S1-C subfamily serine protease